MCIRWRNYFHQLITVSDRPWKRECFDQILSRINSPAEKQLRKTQLTVQLFVVSWPVVWFTQYHRSLFTTLTTYILLSALVAETMLVFAQLHFLFFPYTGRLHFPAFLVVRWNPMTELRPTVCEQKQWNPLSALGLNSSLPVLHTLSLLSPVRQVQTIWQRNLARLLGDGENSRQEESGSLNDCTEQSMSAEPSWV